MSEDEMWVGKLKEIDPKGKDLEELCKYLISEIEDDNDFEGGYWKSYLEMLKDSYFDTYIESNGKIYEISEKKHKTPGECFEATKNIDGTIDYTVAYYNGGCCFSEAIEIALENIKN